MAESSNSIITKKFQLPVENDWLCTLKLTLNLLTHILICLVVLVCLWYSCRSSKLDVLQLHIMLCVLGYQFFMCQGILVLSKFNNWSMFIKRRHRRSFHWCVEIIGTVLIVVGTIKVIKDKRVNFNTTHGILGFCALITTLLTLINGVMTSLATKFSYRINLASVSKWIHGITGIGTLFLSAASLHHGFEKQSFKKWIDNQNFIFILKIFTWLFTVLAGIEFWVIIGQRIRNKINLRSEPQ